MARACVASVRYFYPDIEILLIKDTAAGDFCTRELEEAWSVKCLETTRRAFGWGFVHLETLFVPRPGRYLCLDCDIVLLGPVLDELEKDPADFIVALDQDGPATLEAANDRISWMHGNYYHPERLPQYDPDYVYPGFLFNAGQFVGTPSLFDRDDLSPLIEWTEPPRVRDLHTFGRGDQGPFNYFLTKQAALGRIQLSVRPYMHWPGWPGTADFSVPKIAAKTETPKILHWAGRGTNEAGRLARADIFRFFETHYYTRIADGRRKRIQRNVGQILGERLAGAARGVKRFAPQSVRNRLKKSVYRWVARLTS